MAKKKATKKEENSLNLETILFNCRDYLRGSASLNDKRDVILTLVFLRFIGEKFDDAQAEMRQQCINRGITDEEKIARFLDSPSRYKNIVYVPEAARWSMLINVPASNLVAALDDALQAIEGSSLWVAALTVMAMDVRHVLYGPSLRSRIRSALDKKKTALWAFGLTDEVFAAATARLVRDNRRWSENWMLGLAFTSWASWVCGTLAGAWSGNGLLVDYPAVEAALGFMLPALFMSFLLASFQRQQSLCVTAALAGALGGILLFSIPAAILAGIVCGCLTALLQAMLKGMPDEQ